MPCYASTNARFCWGADTGERYTGKLCVSSVVRNDNEARAMTPRIDCTGLKCDPADFPPT